MASWSIISSLINGKAELINSLENLFDEYEDERNSAIAAVESDTSYINEDFYEQVDNRIQVESSMNMIFFGPVSAFMRLDPETILHILLNTKGDLIPINRVLLAWDIITDGKTAAYLQRREYSAFGTLLNVVPEEDLYYVNFGDISVLRYFANNNIGLDKRKIGVLVAAYRRYFGNNWHMSSEYINELGYLLCGFPSYMLKKIEPTVFKTISPNVLAKLTKCDINQTKTLFEIATHNDAYGDPRKWTSYEIGRLNYLFIFISNEDISALQLEAVAALSPSVLQKIHKEKLKYFTKQQIMIMNPKTRRLYILRMQLKTSLDVTQLAKQSGASSGSSTIFIFSIILTFTKHITTLF